MNLPNLNEKTVLLKKGDRSVFKEADITIGCATGILWVTWPGSGDIILTENQIIHVRVKGKLCITSLADSEMRIINVTSINSLKNRVRIFTSAVFSLMKRDTDDSLFRDSIIQYIR